VTVDPRPVVPLSRWRALLARSRSPGTRLDALLSDPGAAALVPRLPVQDVYWLARSVGPRDALELLRLATPAQLRACIDLDAWDRDRLSDASALAWLAALAALGPEQLLAGVRALDAELVALLVARHLHVHDRSLGEAPDPETPNALLATPDDYFVLEVTTTQPEVASALQGVLELLYRGDPGLARALLLEAKWSTPLELEELAYRWRGGRTADLGLVSFEEAAEIYAYLDPRSVRAGEGRPPVSAPDGEPMLPALFVEPLAEDSFVGRALARIDDAVLIEELTTALAMLINRVLVADGVDLSEPDAVRGGVARARDTLSVGLEYLTDGSLDRSTEVLSSVTLPRIFRAGHSLALELRRPPQLRTRGVDDPDLEPLLGVRPLLPGPLDEPPRAGPRPLRALADVRRVASWLGTLGARVATARDD
jgi:hypothetical protein